MYDVGITPMKTASISQGTLDLVFIYWHCFSLDVYFTIALTKIIYSLKEDKSIEWPWMTIPLICDMLAQKLFIVVGSYTTKIFDHLKLWFKNAHYFNIM